MSTHRNCTLTECLGRPRCEKCLALDAKEDGGSRTEFVLNALDRAVALLRSIGDRNSSKDDPYGGLFWYDDADTIETFVAQMRAAMAPPAPTAKGPAL